jgi:hypothetical protein
MILLFESLKLLFKISIKAIIQSKVGKNINMNTMIRCIAERQKHIFIKILIKITIKS